ncbi:hypothetical protein HN419_06175 [Candidatus Woesearchaeota archaeon]|jgi:glycerate dehydrogenase|nr:hypothetical protein [Candidatus Woesearchaeota archaeon]MBT3538083.1 hypothetical protein [Candidatus Woesearchaeota archaeon]MBT7105752.1 hypothetical protein [Candidatus Woesearchaeota archaeon]MBT7930589.1 hypothetical protein [Candidatus Woesearchaeota archaeon]
MGKKIVTLGMNLKDEHKQRLESIGELIIQESPESVEDFLSKTEGADVIFSNGDFLLDVLPKLKNVFVVYPYVELGVFNTEELEKNGVQVANSQGGNKDSIVEWTMFMILSLFRKFSPMVRATENFPVELQESLVGKNILIVGRGSIGSQVGNLCEAFGMKINFFNRGDDLATKAEDADLVVNSLNCNTSSKNLLDETFFMGMKKGSFYLTFSRPYTYEIEGLIRSIDAGIVANAAIDCDPEKFGDTTNDFYQKCLSCEKILVTPHIAFSTKQAVANGGEIAIQNIKTFIGGSPQNILKKK